MQPIIYHVTTKKEWVIAQISGNYKATSLATEGFIHCSTAEQVNGVLERYFKGQTNLVKLVIDTVVEAGGIAYAAEKMNQYRDEALQILHEFPEGEVRKAMEELVRYTTDRKY